jgi:hypothetical protein
MASFRALLGHAAIAGAIAIAAAAAAGGQPPPTSQWVFKGADGRLHYRALPSGDTIIDFSSAGYLGGGVALPTAPVMQTISPSGGDDTDAIQGAIDWVSALDPDPSGLRGAVLLTPGTFTITRTLTIAASGVVLRGSGSGTVGSTLDMTGSPNPFLALNVRGSGSWQTVGRTASIVDSYLPSGSLSFNVDDASTFTAGDPVLINRPVTSDWVAFMGMDTLVRNGLPQTWIRVGSQIRTDRVISAINGNQITLNAPITDSFDLTLLSPPGGSLVRYAFASRISQVGVEHLRIVAPAEDVDISFPQYQALTMTSVIDGWVQDVAIQDTDNSVSIGSGTKQITLDAVTVSHSLPFTHSAGPADFSVSGTQILLNKCASLGNSGVWAFVTQAEVTGPVVLLNCSADSRGFAPHQRWATGLLADGCQFPGGSPGIAYSDRGHLGSGQGWDAGWAVAWNVTSPTLLVQMPPGGDNWCIGCVGREISANEPNEPPKPVPNGTFDSPGTPVTPSSLYLAQMCDRLGPQAVANIGYPGACDAPRAPVELPPPSR